MQTVPVSALVLCALVYTMSSAAAQPPVGALAVDERQGDQYGWAVDYETAGAAQAAALRECGGGCRVVLTFARCAAYAADQDADSTAVGWAESFASSSSAQQAALSECSSRGGTGCIIRVWGCNGPVVEEGLELDRAARQRIQRGLQVAGFDPGGADGMFGPRTRAAIRGWQSSRGARPTGYLDGASVAALRSAASVPPAAVQQPPVATAEQETVFWQSIANSTNPAEFEAYLRRFPAGMFSELAQIRLEVLRAAASGAEAAGGFDARGRFGSAVRPDLTCAGQPAGTSCWMEISGRSGCHVWNPGLEPGATVTWTGECVGGFAQGMETLRWVWDGNQRADTGRLVSGEQNGHWVERLANGQVQEGPYVNGVRHGHWVVRAPDGRIEEGPLVDGERHGDWILRDVDGNVLARGRVDGNVDVDGNVLARGRYVDGQLVDRQ